MRVRARSCLEVVLFVAALDESVLAASGCSDRAVKDEEMNGFFSWIDKRKRVDCFC